MEVETVRSRVDVSIDNLGFLVAYRERGSCRLSLDVLLFYNKYILDIEKAMHFKKKKRFCKLPQRSGPQQAGSQGGGEEEDYSDVILLALPSVLISLHHVKASPHLLRTSRASPVNTPFFPNSLSSQFCLFFQHGRWSLEEHEFRSHR